MRIATTISVDKLQRGRAFEGAESATGRVRLSSVPSASTGPRF